MIDFFISQSQPIYNLISQETLHYLVRSKPLNQTDGNFPEWPQKAMLNLRHDYFHHVPCRGNTLSRRHQWKSHAVSEPQPHKDTARLCYYHDTICNSLLCWTWLYRGYNVQRYVNVELFTLRHGNAYFVTDHLWGESIGHRWILLTIGKLCWTYVLSLFLTNCLTNSRYDASDLRYHEPHVTSLKSWQILPYWYLQSTPHSSPMRVRYGM